jgi:hypothetical protein
MSPRALTLFILASAACGGRLAAAPDTSTMPAEPDASNAPDASASLDAASAPDLGTCSADRTVCADGGYCVIWASEGGIALPGSCEAQPDAKDWQPMGPCSPGACPGLPPRACLQIEGSNAGYGGNCVCSVCGTNVAAQCTFDAYYGTLSVVVCPAP